MCTEMARVTCSIEDCAVRVITGVFLWAAPGKYGKVLQRRMLEECSVPHPYYCGDTAEATPRVIPPDSGQRTE